MVEFETDGVMDRNEAATFLRAFADELEGPGDSPDIGAEEAAEPQTMTVIVGGESATVVLPEELELDVEIESRSPLLGSEVEQSIAMEFTWGVEDVPEDDAIEIV